MSVDPNSSSQKPTQPNAEATAIELQNNVFKINDRILSGAGKRTYVKKHLYKNIKGLVARLSDDINFFW